MIQVLMCGNHPTNRGGMTSVISQIREHDWEKEGVNLRFIPTYLPGNPLRMTAYFIREYMRIRQVMIDDKPEILHVHMSYKGSFTRATLLHSLFSTAPSQENGQRHHPYYQYCFSHTLL